MRIQRQQTGAMVWSLRRQISILRLCIIIMIKVLLLMLLCLLSHSALVQAISEQWESLSSPQTGSMVLLSPTYVGVRMYFNFTLSYKRTYTSNLKFLLALCEFYNSVANNFSQLYEYQLSSTHTTLSFKTFFYNYGFTPNSLVRYNYLVTSDPNFVMAKFIIAWNFTSNLHTATLTSTFSLAPPSVYKGCFLTQIIIITQTPNIFSMTCTVNSADTLKFDVTVATTVAPQHTQPFVGYYLFIKDTPFASAVYTVDSVNTPALVLNTSATSTIFLIGIQSWNISSANPFEIGFDMTSKKITTRTTYFNQLSFNYLHTFEISSPPQARLLQVAVSQFQSRVNFTFQGLDGFQETPPNLPSFTLPLEYQYYSQNLLKARIKAELAQASITVNLKTSNSLIKYNFEFSLVVFAARRVVIQSLRNRLTVLVSYTDPQASTNDFRVNGSYTLSSYQRLSNGSALIDVHIEDATSDELLLFYREDFKDHIVVLRNLRLKALWTSAKSKQVIVEIHKSGNYALDATKFQWAVSYPAAQPFVLQPNGAVRGETQYPNGASSPPMQIGYVPDALTKFETALEFGLVTVRHVHIHVSKSKTKVVWMNVETGSGGLGGFSVGSGGPAPQSVEIVGDLVEVLVDSSGYTAGAEFEMTYTTPDSIFQATTEKIACYTDIFENISIFNNNSFVLTLKNVEGLTDNSTLNIDFSPAKARPSNIEVIGQFIVIECEILATVKDEELSIVYESDNSTLFHHIVTLSLGGESSLFYCLRSASLAEKAGIIDKLSMVVAALYLAIFLLALFSCKKMLGVELIYLVQLAFYSLIPINVYCDPFRGLEGLKFASGLTPLFGGLPSNYLPSNYSSLSISSNFFSNVNVLLLPVFVLPLLYYPLTWIGEKSNDYHTKPRCLRYGKSLAFEVPLLILLFNSFGVCASFAIGAQFSHDNYFPFATSVIAALLLPLFVVVFVKYNQHFHEFRSEFEDYDGACGLGKDTTTKIRRMYPVLLILEFVLAPLLLSIQGLAGASLYAVAGLEVAVTVLVAMFPLYPSRRENIRNYAHRAVVLAILTLQIFTMTSKHEQLEENSLVFWTPFALLGLLCLGLLLTGGFTVFESVKFWKSPQLVDGILKIKLISQKEKPVDYVPQPSDNTPRSHPRSEFVPFRAALLNHLPQTPLVVEQNQINTYDHLQKFIGWFQQIGKKNLFKLLNISKQEYEQLRSANPDKYYLQNYMIKLFPGIRMFQLLFDFHDTMMTIEHMIDFVLSCQKESFRLDHKIYLEPWFKCKLVRQDR